MIDNDIREFSGPWAFLSNFSRSPMMIDGRLYQTVEHYFQSKKAEGTTWEQKIQMARTPGEAKRLGRACSLREDWEQVKEGVMYRGLQEKFSTPWLRQRLLETGDALLVEGNTWGDRYWGQVNGVGQNRLGVLLMRLREEIRQDRTVTL